MCRRTTLCILFIIVFNTAFSSCSGSNDSTVEYDVFPGVCHLDYFYDEILDYTMDYQYNNDNLLERRDYSDDEGDLIAYFIYEYNSHLLLIKESEFSPSETPGYYNYYFYDDMERLSRMESDGDADGEIEAKYVYKYDGQGNNTAEEIYDGATDNLVGVDIHEYNESNQLILTKYCYDYEDVEYDERRYFYDDKGNLTLTERYNYDDKVNRDSYIEYIYDKNNFKIEESRHSISIVTDVMVYEEHIWWEYDEFGNMLEEFHDFGTPSDGTYEEPMDDIADSRYVYNYDCWE